MLISWRNLPPLRFCLMVRHNASPAFLYALFRRALCAASAFPPCRLLFMVVLLCCCSNLRSFAVLQRVLQQLIGSGTCLCVVPYGGVGTTAAAAKQRWQLAAPRASAANRVRAFATFSGRRTAAVTTVSPVQWVLRRRHLRCRAPHAATQRTTGSWQQQQRTAVVAPLACTGNIWRTCVSVCSFWFAAGRVVAFLPWRRQTLFSMARSGA